MQSLELEETDVGNEINGLKKSYAFAVKMVALINS